MTYLDDLNRVWLEQMRSGRFEEAWCTSDESLRLRAGIDCSRWPRHQQFIWRGESLAGQRILVRCYHGLGDTIQFVRLMPMLRRIARRTILWVQPELARLMESVSGIDSIALLHDGEPQVEFDTDVELSELMHVFRIVPATLPRQVPYCHAAPPSHRSPRAARRVGLVWRSGEWDTERSIPCQLLRPLGQLPGIDWLVLQRGPALKSWRHEFGVIPAISDIVEEARVLRELDLLITVDTCSAHLAGALGVPVWTLLRKDADWRWMRNRSDSPWYPTMRLFRQQSAGDWESVVQRVKRELAEVVARSTAGGSPMMIG